MYFSYRDSQLYTAKFLLLALSLFILMFFSFLIILKALKKLKQNNLTTNIREWQKNN